MTTPDDVTEFLADIRMQAEDHHLVPGADALRVVAAVEAALKLADELEHIKTGPPSGKEDEVAALGLRWCAAKIREAITAALAGKEE